MTVNNFKMPLADNKIWDLYALCYDQVNQSALYRNLLSSIVEKSTLQSGQTILDAGCGTGNLAVLISKLGLANIRIEAVDHNQGMINRALKKNLGSQSNFQLMDLNQKLPFHDDYFDRVFLVHVLYALKNPEATLAELYRVLKPGGLLVLANPHDQTDVSVIMKANLQELNWLRKIYLLIVSFPIIIINFVIYRLGRVGQYHFLSRLELTDLLINCGFVDISLNLAYADQDLLVKASKK